MANPTRVPDEVHSIRSKPSGANSGHRRFRWPVAAIAFVGISIGFRSYWWPVPFQFCAQRALAQHDNEAVLGWLDWATWLTSEDGETAFLRMRTFRRMGRLDQMAQAMNRAYQLRYSPTRLQREQWLGQAQFGQLADVERHLATMLSDPQGDTEEICEAYVTGYVQAGRVSHALQILQSWMNDWPTQARPYLLRARLWNRIAKFRHAVEDLQRAQQLDPTDLDVQFEFGTTLRKDGQSEQAMYHFENCLNRPRFALRARIEMARCLRSTNDVSRAARLLVEALKQESENAQALAELGRLQLESGRYSDAVATLQSAVHFAPRDRDLDDLLGQALKADGQIESAKTHLQFR